eukprot:jgi/Sobl393_1/5803/SZX61597.1
MPCASQNRLWQNRQLQLLPVLSPAAVPLLLLLLLLAADRISGQGLLLRRQDLGASNKPQNVQPSQQYLLAHAKASQLLGRVRSLSQPCGSGSSCRGCLCGWDVTNEDDRDVLSILASPAAYDARLPEHT